MRAENRETESREGCVSISRLGGSLGANPKVQVRRNRMKVLQVSTADAGSNSGF